MIALINSKINLFVKGRKETFSILGHQIKKEDKTIWLHAASLGEYEQGLPILEQLKHVYPSHKIVLSFFSPSGYEVKKDRAPADIVVYLPMDTIANAREFISIVNPSLAIFIKYEIWPNFLKELKRGSTPILLVSAIFSRRQIFFKPYGGFMRKSLKSFSHFFIQDDDSKKLLKTIGIDNCTVNGDTRFDRVSQILNNNNTLGFMGSFKGDTNCMVAGSTWPEDEEVIVNHINTTSKDLKFVIAPHNIKSSHIEKLLKNIDKNTILYSKMEGQNLNTFDVLIIDTIGILTKIYSYANIAYVGGGFATGLHNTLEPAVFGIPVIIGPNYQGFKEAEDLVVLKGIISIRNKTEFKNQLEQLLSDKELFQKTSEINSAYIKEKIGATELVMNHIAELI